MVSQPSAVPVRRVRYRTDDVDEAVDVVRAQYVEHEPVVIGAPVSGGPVYSLDADRVGTATGSLDIARMRYTVGMTVVLDRVQRPTVVIPIAGSLRYTCGREEAPGIQLVPTWAKTLCEFDDIDLYVAALDPDGLRRVGAEVSGLTPEQIEFAAMTPLSPGLGRYVASVVEHLKRDVLSNDEIMTGMLARGQAVHTLATAMLVTFPNTTHTLDPARDPARAEPATIRRAVALIDANAHRDVTLTEIAAAARLGVRGLQMAFRRHRDTTPLAYLRRVRMERAHRDLQAGDPLAGDTVTAIAARWGFTHAGAFSLDYRRTFGCSPSHTLRG